MNYPNQIEVPPQMPNPLIRTAPHLLEVLGAEVLEALLDRLDHEGHRPADAALVADGAGHPLRDLERLRVPVVTRLRALGHCFQGAHPSVFLRDGRG